MGRPRLFSDAERKAKRKECSAASYAKHKEEILSKQAARYARDPGKVQTRNAAWRAENSEQYKASRKEWESRNRKNINARKQAHRKKDPSRSNFYHAQWRASHPEIVAAALKKHRAKNAVEIRRKRAIYLKVNRAKINVIAKRWRDANPDKQRQYRQNSKKAHPGGASARENKRRAIKKQAPISGLDVIQAWVESWRSKRKAVCFWCQAVVPSKGCHADHIVPLSKGGAHAIENLCISCAPCNGSKNARLPEEWNARIAAPVLL